MMTKIRFSYPFVDAQIEIQREPRLVLADRVRQAAAAQHAASATQCAKELGAGDGIPSRKVQTSSTTHEGWRRPAEQKRNAHLSKNFV
jgi:hypothetical protein